MEQVARAWIVLVVVLAFAGPTTVWAIPSAAGDLDPSFGRGGIVTTDFGNNDSALDLLVQPDGKIVAAGTSSGHGFALARYEALNGGPDATFGADGTVTTEIGLKDVAFGVAIQFDGKLVAAGYSQGVDFQIRFAVARYMPDSSLDATFGGDGTVTTDFGDQPATAFSVGVQSNGRIIAAGYAESEDIPGQQAFALARYMPDGSLDPTFGRDGKVTTDIGDGAHADAIAIQPGGKTLVGGGAGSPGELGSDFALARYDRRGRLDRTFGQRGTVTTDLGQSEGIRAIAIQPDGKIVVAGGQGIAGGPAEDAALARYERTGELDPGFGTGGSVITDFGGKDGARDVAIQADGKIVVCGDTVSGGTDFALARYESDGHLDPVFGTEGVVVTDLGGNDTAWGTALQQGGRLVLAGHTVQGGTVDFALARYIP